MNVFNKILNSLFNNFKSNQYDLLDLNSGNSHLGWENWDKKTMIGHSLKVKLKSGDFIKVSTKTKVFNFKVKNIAKIDNFKSKIMLE